MGFCRGLLALGASKVTVCIPQVLICLSVGFEKAAELRRLEGNGLYPSMLGCRSEALHR